MADKFKAKATATTTATTTTPSSSNPPTKGQYEWTPVNRKGKVVDKNTHNGNPATSYAQATAIKTPPQIAIRNVKPIRNPEVLALLFHEGDVGTQLIQPSGVHDENPSLNHTRDRRSRSPLRGDSSIHIGKKHQVVALLNQQDNFVSNSFTPIAELEDSNSVRGVMHLDQFE